MTLIGITPLTGDALEADSAKIATDLTNELGVWVKGKIPPILSDKDFAATSAALIIALSRKLAECAVAFGETHKVPPSEVQTMIVNMVQGNYGTALSISREMGTVQ